MYPEGTTVRMTKGYRGASGVIAEKIESPFGFYIVELQSGIRVVAGATAFVVSEDAGEKRPETV
jgi:hypothetical protein